jgi:hypothetical protein
MKKQLNPVYFWKPFIHFVTKIQLTDASNTQKLIFSFSNNLKDDYVDKIFVCVYMGYGSLVHSSTFCEFRSPDDERCLTARKLGINKFKNSEEVLQNYLLEIPNIITIQKIMLRFCSWVIWDYYFISVSDDMLMGTKLGRNYLDMGHCLFSNSCKY